MKKKEKKKIIPIMILQNLKIKIKTIPKEHGEREKIANNLRKGKKKNLKSKRSVPRRSVETDGGPNRRWTS